MNANRETLAREVAERLGVPAADCRACLEGLLRAVVASLRQGRPVMLRGFGTWSLRQRKARNNVRVPGTGAACRPVPARRVVRFVAAPGMGR